MDTQVAVQTLKRYLAEDKHSIKLHDFVMDEVNYRKNKYPSGLTGCFVWRNKIKNQIDLEVQSYGENWQPLQAGLFDGSLNRFL